MINVDRSGSIAGRRADRYVGFDHLSMAAIVFFDAQNVILHSFCEKKIFPKSRQFENVVDEISLGDGDTILAVVVDSLDVIEVRVGPVDVFVGEIQRDAPRIDDFVEDEARSLGAVQRRTLQFRLRAPIGEKDEAFGRVDGDAPRILQLFVDDGDARDAVGSAEKDAVHDVVDEIPIGSEPIVSHLLDVIQTLRKGDGPFVERGIDCGALHRAQRRGVRGGSRHLLIGFGGDPTNGFVSMIHVHRGDGVGLDEEFGF